MLCRFRRLRDKLEAIDAVIASAAKQSIGIESSFGLLRPSASLFCAGSCIVGGQIAANALAATFYPTLVRATGVGWALGIGARPRRWRRLR
jgi:AAHS family 4-hydroxybenzoate transporter-like MFS transporter